MVTLIKYRSKVSYGLLCAILFFTIVPIVPVILLDFSWMPFILVAGILLFELYLMFGISYIIEGTQLIVQCGLLSKNKYEIMDIRKIKGTHDLIASPAASLDRIAIYFMNQKSPLIISPKRKLEFINTLKSINTRIVYDE